MKSKIPGQEIIELSQKETCELTKLAKKMVHNMNMVAWTIPTMKSFDMKFETFFFLSSSIAMTKKSNAMQT